MGDVVGDHQTFFLTAIVMGDRQMPYVAWGLVVAQPRETKPFWHRNEAGHQAKAYCQTSPLTGVAVGCQQKSSLAEATVVELLHGVPPFYLKNELC